MTKVVHIQMTKPSMALRRGSPSSTNFGCIRNFSLKHDPSFLVTRSRWLKKIRGETSEDRSDLWYELRTFIILISRTLNIKGRVIAKARLRNR